MGLMNFIEGDFVDSSSLEELNKDLLNNLVYLKKLDSREYILHLKYNELKDTYHNTKGYKISSYPKMLMSYDDVKQFMSCTTNKVELVYCSTKELLDIWTMGRKFVSSMPWKQNPGRNLKFLLMINDKIAGFMSLGSEVIAISCRDKYIGWDADTKLKTKKTLNNSAIATTIVPTQPFGYMTTGGKLLCLMLYHTDFAKLWEQTYGDKLVGLTTTSLFGINSQYCGFPKYWKVCGETNGEIHLYPYDEIYKRMMEWLKNNHADELEDALKATSKSGIATGPKARVMHKYLQLSGFRDMWKENTEYGSSDLKHRFKRGVFYARYFDNTNDFLRGEITKEQLIERTGLDFSRDSVDEIVSYWRRKWADKRWNKTKTSDKTSKLFMTLKNINNINEFVRRYV